MRAQALNPGRRRASTGAVPMSRVVKRHLSSASHRLGNEGPKKRTGRQAFT